MSGSLATRSTPSPTLPSASSLSGSTSSLAGRDRAAQLSSHVHSKLAALALLTRSVPLRPRARRRRPDVWFNLETWEPEGAREAARDRDGQRMVLEVVARGGVLRVADGRGGWREIDARHGVLLETWSLTRTWVSEL